jgi:hypothetical protein
MRPAYSLGTSTHPFLGVPRTALALGVKEEGGVLHPSYLGDLLRLMAALPLAIQTAKDRRDL